MEPAEYIRTLVAHYLKEEGLHGTYDHLEKELATKFNTSIIHESLDTIVHDRINFKELNIPDEENGNTTDGKDHGLKEWGVISPEDSTDIKISSANELVISCTSWNSSHSTYEIFITNTNKLIMYNIELNTTQLSLSNPLSTGAQMKTISTSGNFVFICDMNGTLNVFHVDESISNLQNALSSGPLKLHKRLITDFKVLRVDDSNDNIFGYFASIGWDKRVVIGKFLKTDIGVSAHVIGEFSLPTNPTCVSLSLDEKTKLPILLVGRMDSTLLSMFAIRKNDAVEIARISLNDSEFSNYSFQPMSIANSQKNIFSIGTDHLPYMRLITVILPSIEEIVGNKKYHPAISNSTSLDAQLDSIASQQETIQTINSKVPVVRQLIISNYNTMSPQDKYSNAIVLPRYHENGVWIVGDDGIIRGFDLSSGKIKANLKGNSGRAKCASVGHQKSGEYLIFCGALDKKIKMWTSC